LKQGNIDKSKILLGDINNIMKTIQISL